jgi:DNA-binding transcriptional LysR family regulator
MAPLPPGHHDAVAGVRGVLRGQLRIGTIQTLGVIDLPALLTTFSRAHPDVSIRLVDPELRERRFVDYRADSALHAQIDVPALPPGWPGEASAKRRTCSISPNSYTTGSASPSSPHEPARGHSGGLDPADHTANPP